MLHVVGDVTAAKQTREMGRRPVDEGSQLRRTGEGIELAPPPIGAAAQPNEVDSRCCVADLAPDREEQIGGVVAGENVAVARVVPQPLRELGVVRPVVIGAQDVEAIVVAGQDACVFPDEPHEEQGAEQAGGCFDEPARVDRPSGETEPRAQAAQPGQGEVDEEGCPRHQEPVRLERPDDHGSAVQHRIHVNGLQPTAGADEEAGDHQCGGGVADPVKGDRAPGWGRDRFGCPLAGSGELKVGESEDRPEEVLARDEPQLTGIRRQPQSVIEVVGFDG